MTTRTGIAKYAFEQFLRQMAIDADVLPRRLWDAFHDFIYQEQIYADLNEDCKSRIDSVCEHYFGCHYNQLESEIIRAAIDRLNDISCRSAFNDLMQLKDAIERASPTKH